MMNTKGKENKITDPGKVGYSRSGEVKTTPQVFTLSSSSDCGKIALGIDRRSQVQSNIGKTNRNKKTITTMNNKKQEEKITGQETPDPVRKGRLSVIVIEQP